MNIKFSYKTKPYLLECLSRNTTGIDESAQKKLQESLFSSMFGAKAATIGSTTQSSTFPLIGSCSPPSISSVAGVSFPFLIPGVPTPSPSMSTTSGSGGFGGGGVGVTGSGAPLGVCAAAPYTSKSKKSYGILDILLGDTAKTAGGVAGPLAMLALGGLSKMPFAAQALQKAANAGPLGKILGSLGSGASSVLGIDYLLANLNPKKIAQDQLDIVGDGAGWTKGTMRLKIPKLKIP